MSEILKIKSITPLTHDVLRIVLPKPEGLKFEPGQAADVAINKPGWGKEWRSFTFTSLPEENEIEFNIKTYPSHQGVTNELLSLSAGDELIIGSVYGDIHYQGEGVFIAGGAGITPFKSILKKLAKEKKLGKNKLIFANKTKGDIISESYFEELLGENFINVLSDEKAEGYLNGYVTKEIIQDQVEGEPFFYVCAPPPMMKAVEGHLAALGVNENRIIKEGF